MEFDALREPERTRFPQIGAWLRAKGMEFNEIPTPQMLWRGKFWPDLYISNRLDAVEICFADFHFANIEKPSMSKGQWRDDLPLEVVSLWQQGVDFHESFIEPICRKITSRSSSAISAKFHRSVWCPLYYPETLRARASIRTPFYYPRAGYAGVIGEAVGFVPAASHVADAQSALDTVSLSLTYLLAKPAHSYSVCFVVDDSEIYRVTDMDVSAGLNPEYHRFVVESRGYGTDILKDLQRMGLTGEIKNVATGSAKMPIPTIKNVLAGWKPAPHMNDQLWAMMEAERAVTQS